MMVVMRVSRRVGQVTLSRLGAHLLQELERTDLGHGLRMSFQIGARGPNL